ncbi:MAG TPA: hypothetical protein VKH37_12545, partial [Ferruginibacter sp.]|nr:hypothetical protein [Ferruginibacter sp.]
MRNKTLLLLVMVCVMTSTQAQSKKSTTAFAITSAEKGQSGWKDVRLVDLTTGAEIQTVFKSGQDIEILNARTGKPVQKKDEQLQAAQPKPDLQMFTVDANNSVQRINSKEEMEKLRADGKRIMVIRNNYFESKPQYDKPFATNSAAMAYDKKHDRLYYTPMGINQLRYIDL